MSANAFHFVEDLNVHSRRIGIRWEKNVERKVKKLVVILSIRPSIRYFIYLGSHILVNNILRTTLCSRYFPVGKWQTVVQTKPSLSSVFINKVLLDYGHPHSLTYGLWLLLSYNGWAGYNSVTKKVCPANNIPTIWSFSDNYCWVFDKETETRWKGIFCSRSNNVLFFGGKGWSQSFLVQLVMKLKDFSRSSKMYFPLKLYETVS